MVVNPRAGQRSYWFREGWWWVGDRLLDDGYVSDPEGPFISKAAARRHLALTLRDRPQHLFKGWVNGLMMNGRTIRRPVIRHVMQQRRYIAAERLLRAKISSDG
jgi:hypothetical protein